LHEMVHVWLSKNGKRRRGVMHGLAFRVEALRVGAPLYCRSYEGMHRPYKYEWECPRCGMRIRTRIRRDWACKSCCNRYNRGRYDPDFRLRIIKVLDPRG
jgi:ribosomal protein L37AE/L43A